jgi:hypothetical protein
MNFLNLSARPSPFSILSYEDRLSGMLQWLEDEGFFLWYNEKTIGGQTISEWELMPCSDYFDQKPEGDFYSLTGSDKFRVIEQAFHYLCH